jgi:magnesium transporter
MQHQMSELARLITYRPTERLERMRALSIGEQSAVFELLSPHVQLSILEQFRINEIVNLLDHLDLRQAENVVSRISDPKRQAKIIKQLKGAVRDKIEYFLRFHPKATMSLINFNYLLVPVTQTIGEVADAIEEHHRDTGKFPEVLVHEKGALLGEVPMTTLVRERNSAQLRKYVVPVQTVPYLAEVSEVIDALTVSKRKKLIVKDHDDSVLGIIYADEALALFGNMPGESLYNVAGVDDDERPFDGAYLKFKNRYRWLILNLATCFLAGSTIYLFEDTVDALVVLSMYIPIVAGMGGNSASQTFAVMLRGITLGSISLQNCWPAIWREVGAGLLNGFVIGAIVAIISVIWNGSALLGVVVGITMVAVHLIAGFFGAFIPVFLKSVGKDPAATSTIFITTMTDVGGLFILLGLGSLILM